MGRSTKRKVMGGNGGSSSSSTRKSTKGPRQGNNSGAEDNGQSTPSEGGGQVQVGGGNSGASGGPSSGATMKLNPLLNDVVLANLFKYLDPSSLDSHRMVCKKWWDVSLPVWRSSGITLTLKNIVAMPQWDYQLRTWITKLAKFIEFWEEQCKDAPPYREFCLQDWSYYPTHDDFLQDGRFWQLVGGSMSKLTLVNCNAFRSNNFFKLINKSCPNLETLILENCVFGDVIDFMERVEIEREVPFRYEDPASGEHPKLKSLSVTNTEIDLGRRCLRTTCLQLLSHFPHLASFKWVASMERKPYHNDLQILRAVTRVREQDGGKLPLMQLDLEHPVDVGGTGAVLEGPNQTERRATMGLAHPLNIPLTSIRLAKDMEDADEIKRIVEFHGPALVTLIAVIESSRPCCDFPFGVRLENLKELKISDGFCFSLKFLKFTPNLETLRIVDDGAGRDGQREHGEATTLISNTSIQDLDDVRLLKLTTLQLQYIVTEEEVHRLVKWIPNVTNVEMFLDDRQFAVVYQAWEKLARLKIYGEALTDRGLTGITGVVVERDNGNNWNNDQ